MSVHAPETDVSQSQPGICCRCSCLKKKCDAALGSLPELVVHLGAPMSSAYSTSWTPGSLKTGDGPGMMGTIRYGRRNVE